MYCRHIKYQSRSNNLLAHEYELPELRREIDISDFDSGTPVTHRVELYRCDRTCFYRPASD